MRHSGLCRLAFFLCACLAALLLFLFPTGAGTLNAARSEPLFALVLPEKPWVSEERQSALNFTLDILKPVLPSGFSREHTPLSLLLGIIEPFSGQAVPMQPPQALTAMHVFGEHGERIERTEYLSVIEEVMAWGQPVYRAVVALPLAGVWHFVLQTKAEWRPELDRFVQYVSKVQVPAFGSSEGWESALGLSFEILPLSRPFGLSAGMSFTGRVMRDGKPLADTTVDAAWLNTAIKPSVRPMPTPEEKARAMKNPRNEKQASQKILPSSPYQAVQQLRTGSDGIFTFTCPKAGWWAFAASAEGDSLQDPAGNQKPLEIKTVFWVYLG